MGSYKVKLRKYKLEGVAEYQISKEYMFRNEQGYLVIECLKENINATNHPSCLFHAMEFAMPSNIVQVYCNDEIYKYIWKTRIITSYYTDSDYEELGCSIGIKECELIKDWYDKICRVNENPDNKSPWQFAYNQYILSLSAASIELSYLHLTSALEALLIEGNYELSYRLALNTAMLIGDTCEERKAIFEIVKTAYGIRSKTTHGSVREIVNVLKKEDNFEIFLRFRKIVSNVLFSTYDKDKKDIIKNIQNKIFS